MADVVASHLATLVLSTVAAVFATGGHLGAYCSDCGTAAALSGDGAAAGGTPLPLAALAVSGAAAAVPLILGSRAFASARQHLPPPAMVSQLRTTGMALHMFGRRRQRQDAKVVDSDGVRLPATSGSQPATTAQVVALLGVVSGVTAVSDEVVFRAFLPAAIYATTGSAAVAVIVPVALYGLGHVPWSNPASRADSVWFALQQSAAALWYATLFSLSGSLVPGIVTHWLYDMHTLGASWHGVNCQMDYAEERMSVIVHRAERDDAGIRLSPEASEASRRFFCAMDTERLDSLSLADVQRAVAYAFYGKSPCTHAVANEFHRRAVAHNGDDDTDEARLDYAQFVEVLKALRIRPSQRPTDALQRQGLVGSAPTPSPSGGVLAA